jgi:isoleucyl-tRNA synthetase
MWHGVAGPGPTSGKRGGTAASPRGSGLVVLALTTSQICSREAVPAMSVYPREETGQLAASLPAQPSLPGLEAGVLAYWAANDTFSQSVALRPHGNEFVFYDGPPFANGLPHYGHLITGYVKDVVPRFRAMQGRRVDRRFSWDCHGLPAEVEAERLLGIAGKAEILAMGLGKFNDACRESVLRYTREWRDYVTRQARWVDFENDYKTLDLNYMESVMWAFKKLWDNGLIYEGFKVLPYCWRCETPLSNLELRMDDDVYQDRQDPSVTVRFKLETGEWLLAWTTTPWTLPSNEAVAVCPHVTYTVLAKDGERYILARDRQAEYERELEGAAIVGSLTRDDLAARVGWQISKRVPVHGQTLFASCCIRPHLPRSMTTARTGCHGGL